MLAQHILGEFTCVSTTTTTIPSTTTTTIPPTVISLEEFKAIPGNRKVTLSGLLHLKLIMQDSTSIAAQKRMERMTKINARA